MPRTGFYPQTIFFTSQGITIYNFTGLQRVTDEGLVPDIAQYGPYYLPLNVFIASKGSSFYILFAITAASVVPCGGPKKSPPYTIHSAGYIISFGPLRSVRIFSVLKIVRLEPYSKHCFSYLAPFRNVFSI